MRLTRTFLLPMVVAAAFTMGACGGDDDSPDGTGGESPSGDTQPESSPSPDGSANAGSSQTDDATASSGAGEDPDLQDSSNTTSP